MKKKNIGKAVLFAPAVALTVLGLKNVDNINIDKLNELFNNKNKTENYSNDVYIQRNNLPASSGIEISNYVDNYVNNSSNENMIYSVDPITVDVEEVLVQENKKMAQSETEVPVEIMSDEDVQKIVDDFSFNLESIKNGNEQSNNNNSTTVNSVIDNSVKVKLSPKDVSTLNYYLMQNRTNFSFEKYYSIDEAFKKYNAVNMNYTHNNKLEDITVDNLYNIVLENNKQYRANNSVWMYDTLSNNEIKKICEIIVPVINDYLKGGHGIDAEQVKCNLAHLTMFKSLTSLSYAYVNNEYGLIVNPDLIGVSFSNMSYEKTYEVTLIHETMHILQKPCLCEKENNPNINMVVGFSKKFNDLDVNPLYFSWLAESSAEMNKMIYSNVKALSYTSMIGYMESITMPNMLRDNFSMLSMYDLGFSRDINDLYKFFNVTTDEDKKEVINLVYAIEILQNTPDDFLKKYKEVNNISSMKTADIDDQICYVVKAEICETLSKYFYRNLASVLSNKEISLNDIFFLIKSHETDMNFHSLFYAEDNLKYNKDLLNNYVSLQNEFFGILAQNLNVSLDDIYNMYNSYKPYSKTEDGKTIQNFSLSWLPDNKQRFLKDKLKAQETYYIDSIKSYYDMYQNSNSLSN